ncbi:MAG: nucleotide pyrophosphohydrolase [Elusimicrobiota bacterium]|nr:nucleotide pyrophosphohydrolase [Elusimicrobiota bacterium]
MKKYLKEFEKLIGIFEKLRSSNGCIWDREQTHKSLIKYLFSESKEVKKAIDNNDMENLKEELGDILLQVVFHSQIAKENGEFSISDVVKTLNQKLVRRHPHVFGTCKVKTVKDVERLWKEIKAKE